MELVQAPKRVVDCEHFIGGRWTHSLRSANEIYSPYTGKRIGRIWPATRREVDQAVRAASKAGRDWGSMPIKERTQVMYQFRSILLEDMDKIAHAVSAESGKLLAEARAGIAKGIEVLEFAISLQNLDRGGRMRVSRGVFCEYRRQPLGVVAGITPFNFPAMVPMWMIPIAITLGNSFIWKPSDKTPLTSLLLAKAFQRAGLPDGVLTVLQGGKETVEAICDHPEVRAVAFVGSTPVARAVYTRATSRGKRALTLGGAKNHIILMPDAEPEMAAQGIVSSFVGCAGQRCMAASVVLAVGDVDHILEKVVAQAKKIRLGQDIGAIISKDSLARLERAIEGAAKAGASVLLDGRGFDAPKAYKGGQWLKPTILDNVSPKADVARTELFGPVLAIVRCKNLSEALAVENASPFGNAASVFTTQGGVAEEVIERAKVGMVGVNIGVPVPREPFSFGGDYESKFGHGDITGESSLDFWSNLKKVTTKWDLQKDQNWMG